MQKTSSTQNSDHTLVVIPLPFLTLSRNMAWWAGFLARHEARCKHEIRRTHTMSPYLMPSLYCSRLLWTGLGWGHRGMRCAHLIDSCARIIWKTWPPKPVVPKHACSLGKQPAVRLWWGFPAAAGSSPSHHRSWERGGSACPGRWAPIAPQAMPAGCWKEWQYEDFFIIHHNMVIAQKASE